MKEQKKILTILGARPQFIKASVLSNNFIISQNFQETILHTGQHFDANMSEVFFKQLNVPQPKYNLDINQQSRPLFLASATIKIGEVIETEQPDAVLVYGDTNSTLAGAMAAEAHEIPLIHVEAGLRSFNESMPEENNRVLTDHASTFLLCPSQTAMDNLENENIAAEKCFFTGDVMFDLVRNRKNDAIVVSDLPQQFILSTFHRAELVNDKDKLSQLVEALNHIHKQTPVVVPLHPNTKNKINSLGINPSFICLAPQTYLHTLWLQQHASLILTDSGGLQKEAFYNGKPCITLRKETEWVELLKEGENQLCYDFLQLPTLVESHKMHGFQPSGVYGNGDAGEKIIEILSQSL